jgi:hypothetical protein
MLCTDIFYTKERAAIMNLPIEKPNINENKYLNELVTLCKKTEKKIILMEPKRRIGVKYIKKFGISVFDRTDINDASGSNLFSMYTLPVNGKSISEGEDSKYIAGWLGSFICEEDYIQIFDSYLLTKVGIEYLKKYILKYVRVNADVEIYSLNKDFSEQQIKDIFSRDDFKKWNFSVYIIRGKKDLHARSIQGNKYIIQIDRGLSVFGSAGKTFQTIVSIFENEGVPRIVLKETQLKQII